MADKQTDPVTPVTYRDLHYTTRTIKVGRDELRFETSRVTVTDPVHIKALDKLYGVIREGE